MKLIILNGSSGAGKTTVAKRIHAIKPLSVMVPNYEVRRMISDFKSNRDKSREIMFNLTYGIVGQALSSEVDVIVDSKIHDNCNGNSIVDRLVTLAKEKGAETYEVILQVNKEGSMERIRNRGFSKEAILNEDNLEENVDKFLREMEEYTSSRKGAVIVDTSSLTEEQVFDKVKEIIKE